MDINKLTGALCLISLLSLSTLTSCGGDESVSVSREMYDELQHKYDMLKESVDGTLSANEQARMELNNIMVELNTISGRTMSLQKNVENGSGRDNRTTAEQISASISEIKRRLNSVPTNGADKQTLALVQNLRQTIALNEQEISRLNETIEQKNQQISTLDSELAETNQQLQATLRQLQNSEMTNWLATGDELMSIADLLPDVKGHGNMKGVKKAKLDILLRAKAAYEQASKLGSEEALSKIEMAAGKYNIVYSK